MTTFAKTPQKRKNQSRLINTATRETNNNLRSLFSKQQSGRNFIIWYKHKIDNERHNLGLYLSDDVSLEWFGRTVKTRKKVSSFFKYDMQCSRHDFTTVDSIEKIPMRHEKFPRKEDSTLASPIRSPEYDIPKLQRCGKRRIISDCNSPEWADGCKPLDDEGNMARKRLKRHQIDLMDVERRRLNDEIKHELQGDNIESEINNKGDGIFEKPKRKSNPITPPNNEYGQGDCHPSTSGTGSESSHDALNSQLPKQAVECNGYIEFTRTRNSRSNDSMKWDRKCKVQISYSEDPLNVGEYIIWALRYSDESKCRRNLLAAFEEAAKE